MKDLFVNYMRCFAKNNSVKKKTKAFQLSAGCYKKIKIKDAQYADPAYPQFWPNYLSNEEQNDKKNWSINIK